MNTITREGVIYTRVSSLKQITEGNGLDSQYTACLNFAKNKNIISSIALKMVQFLEIHLRDLAYIK